MEVYLCAKYYEQKALESKCLEEMQSWVIDVKDACELLELEGDVPNLREKCISFIRENGLIVVGSETFAKANERAMAAILASGALEDVSYISFDFHGVLLLRESCKCQQISCSIQQNSRCPIRPGTSVQSIQPCFY